MSAISSTSQFIIGIDSGGTKSELIVWDQLRLREVLSRAKSDVSTDEIYGLARATVHHHGLNLDGITLEEATSRFTYMLSQAAEQLKVSEEELAAQSHIIMGMAGIDTDLDDEYAREWLDSVVEERKLPLQYTLISDVELGLWSGTQNGQGIVLIAGTGSNCFGRNSQAKTAKAGGLSHFFSDEGGGFMLGWEALHAVGKMYDGRAEKTPLYEIVLQEMGVSTFAELKQYIVRAPDYKQAVAKTAPAVQAASEAGDSLAQHLITKAIAELEAMVVHVHAQLGESLLVSFVGGLFQHGPYAERLHDRLYKKNIDSHETHIQHPVTGAVWYWQAQEASK